MNDPALNENKDKYVLEFLPLFTTFFLCYRFAKMAAYVNGNSHHHNEDAFDTKAVAAADSNSISTVDKILGLTSYSSRLEEVLLALLKEQQILKDKVESDMQGLNSRYGSLYSLSTFKLD